MSDTTLPTFNWEQPAEEALTRINEYLETYNPQGRRFQSELYNLLLDLAGHVEQEVRSVYIDRLIQEAHESSLATIEFMGLLTHGQIQRAPREEES